MRLSQKSLALLSKALAAGYSAKSPSKAQVAGLFKSNHLPSGDRRELMFALLSQRTAIHDISACRG